MPYARPKTETDEARAAWEVYRAMPPQEQSIPNLARKLAQDGKGHALHTLYKWSTAFDWPGRLGAEPVRVDAEATLERLPVREHNMEDAGQLVYNVGAAALAICAKAMESYVDPNTGDLLVPILPRDLPALIRAGTDTIAQAMGLPTARTQVWQLEQWQAILAAADDDTRATIIKGLKASRQLHLLKQAADG